MVSAWDCREFVIDFGEFVGFQISRFEQLPENYCKKDQIS